MEKGINNPGKGETEPQDKQDKPLEYTNIYNQEQYETRSVKVMIKFPFQKDSGCPDEKDEGPCSKENDDINGSETMGLPDITADEQGNRLSFYGVVKDSHDKVLEGVAVMVFACYRGGIEKPLGYTFTDNEGSYIISIPEFPDYSELDGFKVRAGKGSSPAEGIGHPVNYGKKSHTPASNKDFHHFLKIVLNNPNKTIFDLVEITTK